ncbi:hypothetical protein BH23GEM9_BH23GEM9_35260 [soil metagenome]
MADIDIQRKEGPPVLPILLGVLAIGAIIAAVLLFTGNGNGRGDAVPGALPYDTAGDAATIGAVTGPGTEGSPMEVRAFRERCADASQFQDEMGLEHQHEADCMRQLAESLDAVIRRETVADQPLQQRIDALRQRAEQITTDPQATDHASRVRSAADEAAQIIEYIAQERESAGANLQQLAQQTRQAAGEIDTGTLLLEQRERTSRFFARAADALDAMAQNRQAQPQR